MRWSSDEAGAACHVRCPVRPPPHTWPAPERERRGPPGGSGAGAADRQRLAEVFVGGEGLARRPADVLATLLHEAAHALAQVRVGE
jgi:hypothetical protein